MTSGKNNNGSSNMNVNNTKPKYLNIPTNKSVLGKRKGGVSSYTRSRKRRDLSMVADIRRVTNEKVTVKLPRVIVNELKKANVVSSRDRIEYAGKINFEKSKNNHPQVKFNLPNRLTSHLRGEISIEIIKLIKDYYITYHTHPAAQTQINNNHNCNNNTRKKLFTLPSGMDFEAYVRMYPSTQANIIADAYGYYVIDIIEAAERGVPDAKKINEAMEGIRKLPFMTSRYRSIGGFEYFESTITEWKYTISTELKKYMRDNHGVSIKYYCYGDETPTITLKRR
jgi:sulfur relay (sulfurtransferase) DsrC/TusE family protein